MKSRIAIALLAAIPIEAINLWICPFPIDVGYPEGTPWYWNLRGALWVFPHLTGIRMWDWLYQHGLQKYFVHVLFVSGYLSTVLVLLIIIFVLRWIRSLPATEKPRI